MKKNNERLQNIYEALGNLPKLIDNQFEKPLHYQGIQLPMEAKYRAEIIDSWYGTADRYSFLFNKKNNYRHLYNYLQTKEEFRDFQVDDLKLYMGLFAYVDYEASDKLGLRYLYGPMDLPGDSNRPQPHFFLKSYFQQGGKFIEESPDQFSNSMESLYYSRLDVAWNKLDFVRILQAEKIFQYKRTQFEKDNDLIYAPSGEMDACILMWVFLMFDEKYKKQLLDFLTITDMESRNRKFLNDSQKTQLDFGLLRPGNINEENYKIPYENRQFSFFEWLKVLGLIFFETTDTWNLTERGIRFLNWMSIYIQAVLQPDLCRYKNYRGILEKINYDLKAVDENVIYNYWLDKTNKDELNIAAGLLKGMAPNKEGIKNQQEIFYSVIKIMLNWNEPETFTKVAAIESFQKRCRFNLYSHFILRAGDRGELREDASRAWIVFPILTETVVDKNPENEKKSQNVGFFLGTFNDSIKQNDKISGFFEDELEGDRDINELLFKLKVIIGKLAEIENREIFYSGIFEDRLSKDLFHKLHHAQYTFLETLRIISKKLPIAQQHVFDLANDCLGKYLDIAKNLPHKLDSYLKNHKTEEISLLEIIRQIQQMINIIFQEPEAAQRIFKINNSAVKLFLDKIKEDSLIDLHDYTQDMLINTNKELTVIIIKELLINALRNTPRYNPLVKIRIESDQDYITIVITNEYSRGGDIEKSIVKTFGLDIIEQLLVGLQWKHDTIPTDTSYSFSLSIPINKKNM